MNDTVKIEVQRVENTVQMSARSALGEEVLIMTPEDARSIGSRLIIAGKEKTSK